MRGGRWAIRGTLALSAVLVGAAMLPAQIQPWRPIGAETPQETSSAGQGLGQLVVTDPQSGSPVRLNVARYHVNVVLQPPVALVQIDQSFYNPYSRQEEGTFVFNLPRGASVSRFAMYVTPDHLMEGEIAERKRASDVYESIVRSQRDPAILEQIGDNLFKMRAFPIFANDVKRILLDFTIPLESDRGRYEFRLPMLSDLQPVWDFQLTGAIRTGLPLESARCVSHPEIALRPQGGKPVSFEWQRRNYRPQGEFVLEFAEKADRRPVLRSFTTDDDGRPRVYFQASVEPAAEKDNDWATLPADVLILVSTSDNQGPLKPLQEAARLVAGKLRPVDRFQLACVDVSARRLSDAWLKPGSPEAEAALAKLNAEFALGGCDLAATLGESMKVMAGPREGRRRLVLFIGNGEITQNTLSAEELLESTAQKFDEAGAAFWALRAPGSRDGRVALEMLAGKTGGLVFNLPEKDGPDRPLDAWLAAGLPSAEKIERIEIPGVAAADLFHPRAILPGQRVALIGRCEPQKKLEISVTSSRSGQRRTDRWELDVPQDRDDVFVGRLWAQRKLDRLRDAEALEENADDNPVRRQITALSQEWSLLSPYTAFLVLEKEEDYQRWNIVRNKRRRYWKPADALPQEPLPASWVAAARAEIRKPNAQFGWQREDDSAFEETLKEAREAMKTGRADYACRLLERVKDWPQAATSAPYADLMREAMTAAQHRALLAGLGRYRSLLDPAAPPSASPLDAGVWSLFGFGASSAYLQRHPLAGRISSNFTLATGPMTIDTLASHLRDYGVNVVVDRNALDMAGIPPDTEIQVHGSGTLPLRSYANIMLEQLGLTLVEEKHRFLITTPDVADQFHRLRPEIYPVSDLLHPTQVAPLHLLSNPELDRETTFRKKAEAALKKPISLNFKDLSLEEVLSEFHKRIGIPMVVDRASLEMAGILSDQAVSATWKDVPAKESLRWILDDLGLDYCLRNDAIVVTTRDVAESQTNVRVYSGRGVVFAYRTLDGVGSAGGMGMGGMGMGGMGMGGMGMGGMGMGGGMGFGGGGSFGGGFGGSMGGGGGLGGSLFGGSSDGAESIMPEEGLSAGGLEEPRAEPLDAVEGLAEGSGLAMSDSPVQPVIRYYFDSIIDMIQNTVQTDRWLDNGGAGTIEPYEPTLSLVVGATEEVHEQIQSLLEHLREMPVLDKDASLSHGGSFPFDLYGPDFDGLIDMITNTVRPDRWLDNGGVGTIEPDAPHHALIVTAPKDVQDGVDRLLTLLRRSRYEQVYGQRPWELGSLGNLAAMAAKPSGPAAQPLRQPKPESVAALAARRELPEGVWKWRRTQSGAAASFGVRRGAARVEFTLPEGLARLEGSASAIAYPELLLVQQSDRGEELRQAMDQNLPWLPHRSNAELAAMFDVEPLPAKDGAARVRLSVPGTDARRAWIEVTFSPQGLPIAWEAFLEGKLSQRLRFDQPADGQWKQVRLEDAAGKRLAQWELADARVEPQKIAALGEGWAEYVQVDRRGEKPAGDAEFRAALEAIGKSDWLRAAGLLAEARKKRPDQPLLALVWAWCCQQDVRVAPKAELLAALRQVAAGRAAGLTRFVAQGNFPRLAPQEMFDLLALQPADTRSAGDWQRLARAAVAVSQWNDALAAARGGLEAQGSEEERFELVKLEVETLSRLSRTDEAGKIALAWAKDHAAPASRLGELGVLLVRCRVKGPGEQLLKQALADRSLSDSARAALCVGWANELLLEAQETREGQQAAELCWQAIRLTDLPDERLLWACQQMNLGGASDRVIEQLEGLLRRERLLTPQLLWELRLAYDAAGRQTDALRATTATRMKDIVLPYGGSGVF